jgi:hypothetical protein
MPGMSSAEAFDVQAEMLMHGCEFGDSQLEGSMRARLRARLAVAAEEHRPLRVYTGYDPTAPDLHLGHSITLRAMRRFRQLGHHVIVVVGTVTAMVGDTSDRAAGRPRKSAAEVAEAARSYAEQAFTILDPARTEVAANGDWLAGIACPRSWNSRPRSRCSSSWPATATGAAWSTAILSGCTSFFTLCCRATTPCICGLTCSLARRSSCSTSWPAPSSRKRSGSRLASL